MTTVAKRCFVISPIGQEGSAERKHADMLLHAIVEPVAADAGYTVKRADGFSAPDMITTNIIDALVNWDLVIADLSFLNPNVFYEIGLRHMTSKPIVHIATNGTLLPFDTAAQRTIFFDPLDWHSHERARKSLRSSIEEMSKDKYKVSNPVTHALGVLKVNLSPDSQDQIIESLNSRLSRLERANVDTPRNALSPNRSPSYHRITGPDGVVIGGEGLIRIFRNVGKFEKPYDPEDFTKTLLDNMSINDTDGAWKLRLYLEKEEPFINSKELATVVTEMFDLPPF